MRRIVLLMVIGVSTASSTFAQTRTRKPPANLLGQSELKAAYRNWLDQDVVYIITPEEKQAFLGLNSDAERERFIEQFWKARDLVNRTLGNRIMQTKTVPKGTLWSDRFCE